MTGAGVLFSLGRWVHVDVSWRLLLYENFQFGSWAGQAGTVANHVITLGAGVQI